MNHYILYYKFEYYSVLQNDLGFSICVISVHIDCVLYYDCIILYAAYEM